MITWMHPVFILTLINHMKLAVQQVIVNIIQLLAYQLMSTIYGTP